MSPFSLLVAEKYFCIAFWCTARIWSEFVTNMRENGSCVVSAPCPSTAVVVPLISLLAEGQADLCNSSGLIWALKIPKSSWIFQCKTFISKYLQSWRKICWVIRFQAQTEEEHHSDSNDIFEINCWVSHCIKLLIFHNNLLWKMFCYYLHLTDKQTDWEWFNRSCRQ